MVPSYPPRFRKLYNKLSRSTGMSNEEIDTFILKLIRLLAYDLHRTGTSYMPYLGRFTLKRMPPAKRSVMDFSRDKRMIIQVEAKDTLKFKISKKFRKIFE